jgi:DNA-3-methyladenine glycosylase I
MIGVGVPDDQPLIIVHADGKPRCSWADAAHSAWVAYHDSKWGTPTTDAAQLFEALTLAIFESGLSWGSIFARRGDLRRAFRSFHPDAVAAMAHGDVDELMADHTIIRNRRKIEATIINARRAAASPSLGELVREHRAPPRRPVTTWSEARARTAESERLCQRLRREGYQLIGPVVTHAFALAVGIDDGHLAGCFRARPLALQATTSGLGWSWVAPGRSAAELLH